jgi:alcohol dehydrogenase (NADP+)
MQDPTLQRIAAELGVAPPKVCLSWAAQRMNKSGGYVAMATRSDWILDNLKCAVDEVLSPDQLLALCGDGTAEKPGIDADNRLIRGQVFLWPEADGDWRILWDDSQVFETRADYAAFKTSWNAHHALQLQTTYRG